METLLSAVNVVIYRAKPKEARVGRTGIVLSVCKSGIVVLFALEFQGKKEEVNRGNL